MERDEAVAALRIIQQRKQAVRAASRAPVTLLAVWGATTFAVEFATAFLSGPWTLAPVGAMLIFIGWAAAHSIRQRVYSHGFTWRYLVVVGAFTALHMAYLRLLTAPGFHHNVPVAVAGSLAVAAPMFVGAYVESRRP